MRAPLFPQHSLLVFIIIVIAGISAQVFIPRKASSARLCTSYPAGINSSSLANRTTRRVRILTVPSVENNLVGSVGPKSGYSMIVHFVKSFHMLQALIHTPSLA